MTLRGTVDASLNLGGRWICVTSSSLLDDEADSSSEEMSICVIWTVVMWSHDGAKRVFSTVWGEREREREPFL